MIDLNALLGRRVEYYEYPWAIEGYLRSTQARLRSLFQPPDVIFVFSKSMPRSGHRFLTECLTHYFGAKLHYCGFYRPDCCHKIPCARPYNDERSNRYFLQKSHDFGFRDAPELNGRYLIQFRSPIPRLQSNYDLAIARGIGDESKEGFVAFAEKETAYFINFYRKWVAAPRHNTLVIAYEDMIGAHERTLAAAIGFVQGHAAIDGEALAATLAQVPVGGNGTPGGLRDAMQHRHFDAGLYARLERQVADACGRSRIKFHFI
jgi:hypothetical protein